MTPPEPVREVPARTLDLEGAAWSVALMGRSVSGGGGSPGVTLGELVFTPPKDMDATARMVLIPVKTLEAFSDAELEEAFRAARPHEPSLVPRGEQSGASRPSRPGRGGRGRGRSRRR